MALDDVATHQGGMARTQLLRQAQAGAHGVVAGVVDGEVKAIRFHMGDPVMTATAAGVFPDFNGRGLGCTHQARRGQRRRQCRQARQQMATLQATVGSTKG